MGSGQDSLGPNIVGASPQTSMAPPHTPTQYVPIQTKPGADTTIPNNVGTYGHLLKGLGLSGSFPFKTNTLLHAVTGLPSDLSQILRGDGGEPLSGGDYAARE
jgi:hypothetical protein